MFSELLLVLDLIKMYDNLPTAQSTRDMQMYTAMYAEVIKNRETTEFILKGQTPYFQIIDSPILPLKKENKRGWVMWALIGFMIGSMMCSGIIIGYHYIKEELDD